MPKYGDGLNREIVRAVNRENMDEPFSVIDVRRFAKQRGWEVKESFITTCLANGSNEQYSHTYRKYFRQLGNGRYELAHNYRGSDWC